MRARKFIVIAVVVVAAIVAARALGLWAGERLFSPSTHPTDASATDQIGPLPPLFVPEASPDDGTVWENKQTVLTIPLCNRTDSPIQILDFETGCNCTSITPRQLTIPAGGQTEIRVEADTTHRLIAETGFARRVRRLQLAAVTATYGTVVVETRYSIRSRMTTSHRFISFGDADLGRLAQMNRKIFVTTHVPHQSVRCASSAEAVNVVCNRDQTNEPSYSIIIKVNVSAITPNSNIDSIIDIELIDNDGKVVDRQQVLVSLRVLPAT